MTARVVAQFGLLRSKSADNPKSMARGYGRRAIAWLYASAAIAVVPALLGGCGTDRRTTMRCPDGFILTAAGCLPVPDRVLPSPDAGTVRPRSPDASTPDADTPAPDTGVASEDSGTDPIDSGEELRPDAATLDLTGSWALRVVGVDDVESDALNTADSVTITTIMRVEIAQAGTTVAMTSNVCSIVSTPFAGYTTSYPQPAIAAIAPSESIVTLNSAELGAAFIPTQRVQLLGWNAVRNAATELLPSDPDDERVVDSDNDNEPGVTLEVNGPIDGQLYVASRSVLELEGTIASNDRIAGLSRAAREQNILDASNGLLAAGDVIITPDPDPTKSTFELVRIPRQMQPTCPEILAAGTALFP